VSEISVRVWEWSGREWSGREWSGERRMQRICESEEETDLALKETALHGLMYIHSQTSLQFIPYTDADFKVQPACLSNLGFVHKFSILFRAGEIKNLAKCFSS
jgi:hypothetical protein